MLFTSSECYPSVEYQVIASWGYDVPLPVFLVDIVSQVELLAGLVHTWFGGLGVPSVSEQLYSFLVELDHVGIVVLHTSYIAVSVDFGCRLAYSSCLCHLSPFFFLGIFVISLDTALRERCTGARPAPFP
jgi:hypothetical protein